MAEIASYRITYNQTYISNGGGHDFCKNDIVFTRNLASDRVSYDFIFFERISNYAGELSQPSLAEYQVIRHMVLEPSLDLAIYAKTTPRSRDTLRAVVLRVISIIGTITKCCGSMTNTEHTHVQVGRYPVPFEETYARA